MAELKDRANINLGEDLKTFLKHRALERGLTLSELVRKVLLKYFKKESEQ